MLLGASDWPLLDQKQALWESAPDEPSYFAEYASIHLRERGDLPPGFLDTARRIDPDNAWFPYLAAAAMAKDVATKKSQSREEKAAGTAPAWEIHDPARHQASLALLHQGNSLARFEPYGAELDRQRMALLPQSTLSERLSSLSYLYQNPSHADYFLYRHLGSALSAKAWQLGEEQNAEELQPLVADFDALTGKLLSSSGPVLLHELIHFVLIHEMVTHLHAAARQAGLEHEAERFRILHAHAKAKADRRKARPAGSADPIAIQLKQRGGLLAWVSLPMIARQTESPPPVAERDLRPGRMADHDLFALACAPLGWLLLGLALAAAALYRFHTGVTIHGLAKRFTSLLLPRDWCWILLGGVLLPWTALSLLAYFTPFGGRDWGLAAFDWPLPAAAAVALVITLLLLPPWMVRWRLSKRAPLAGLASSPGLPYLRSLVLAGQIAFPLLLLGIAPTRGLTSPAAYACWALPAIGFLWLGGAFCTAIGRPPRRHLAQASIFHALIPCYVCAMLLLACSVPVYLFSHQQWFRQDRLLELDPAHPGMTVYEAEVARQMREELRRLIGTAP